MEIDLKGFLEVAQSFNVGKREERKGKGN